ncbi:MAG: MarR family winged helix-turn-helix transcriptional regulator [Bacteroidales bacterium]|jgi:DNA-binding MarR family transcriptional regulator|nr:MarR family winged helix-turn-helix transcriptional regulator [Bacteroidales bacterium]MDD4770979.1 MarR family winged helix-turn-helix transcriptional regulator [Bacteroidales bacterium]HKL92840.1 MarR family winged helix-turn-helix transcriptional regulator [Bacteroidales bacterium]
MLEDICVVKEIYRTLYQFEKDFYDTHKISINDAMVLCCLKGGEEKSAGEVCDFVGLSNSRVSKVLCAVEDMGFIQRRLGSSDRRQMFFSLTTTGKAKVDEMLSKSLHLKELLSKIAKQCDS